MDFQKRIEPADGSQFEYTRRSIRRAHLDQRDFLAHQHGLRPGPVSGSEIGVYGMWIKRTCGLAAIIAMTVLISMTSSRRAVAWSDVVAEISKPRTLVIHSEVTRGAVAESTTSYFGAQGQFRFESPDFIHIYTNAQQYYVLPASRTVLVSTSGTRIVETADSLLEVLTTQVEDAQLEEVTDSEYQSLLSFAWAHYGNEYRILVDPDSLLPVHVYRTKGVDNSTRSQLHWDVDINPSVFEPTFDSTWSVRDAYRLEPQLNIGKLLPELSTQESDKD